jgi:hypothetical protein
VNVDRQVLEVITVLLVLSVLLVHQDLLVQMVLLDNQANQVVLVHKVNMVSLATQDALVLVD